MNMIDKINISTATLTEEFEKISQRRNNPALWTYERLVNIINDFEKNLPENMQAGGRLVSFNGEIFSIEDIGYWGPDIIVFYGELPNGSKVQLVQHTSQLNLLLVAVQRKDDLSNPRRKIGFEHHSQESESD